MCECPKLLDLQRAKLTTPGPFANTFVAMDWVEMMQDANQRFDRFLRRANSGKAPSADELRGAELRKVRQGRQVMLTKTLREKDPATRRKQLREWYLKSAISFVTPRGVMIHHWVRQTQKNIVHAAFAAKLHQFRTGAYPKSIEDILADAKENRRDVLAGKDLRLSSGDDGGLLIYSVGRNLVDEKGDQGGLNSPTSIRIGDKDPDLAVELAR